MADGEPPKVSPPTQDGAAQTQPQPILQKSFAQVVQGSLNIGSKLPSLLHIDSAPIILKPISKYQGQPSVIFTNSDKVTLLKKMNFVLVRKFSHGKPSFHNIKVFFAGLKLQGEFNISIFDHKHLFLEFASQADYTRVWLKLNWNISGFAMRVFKWDCAFSPQKESVVAPIWIRLEGVPLHMFNEAELLSIANAIGKPLRVHPSNLNRVKLNSAQVCVELNVIAPRPKVIWVCFADDTTKEPVEGFWVRVFYDAIPTFCTHCLHIGHRLELCKRRTTVLTQAEKVFDTKSQPTVCKKPDNDEAELLQIGCCSGTVNAEDATVQVDKQGRASTGVERTPATSIVARSDQDSALQAGGSTEIVNEGYRDKSGSKESVTDLDVSTEETAVATAVIAKDITYDVVDADSAVSPQSWEQRVQQIAEMTGVAVADPVATKENNVERSLQDNICCSSTEDVGAVGTAIEADFQLAQTQECSTIEKAADTQLEADGLERPKLPAFNEESAPVSPEILAAEVEEEAVCDLQCSPVEVNIATPVQQVTETQIAGLPKCYTPNTWAAEVEEIDRLEMERKTNKEVEEVERQDKEKSITREKQPPEEDVADLAACVTEKVIPDNARGSATFVRQQVDKEVEDINGRRRSSVGFLTPDKGCQLAEVSSPGSWADKVAEEERQESQAAANQHKGVTNKVPSKKFHIDLPIDFDPMMSNEDDTERMSWSQLISGSIKLLARRSVSPVGRSSEKLIKLRNRVDFLDHDAGKTKGRDKEEYLKENEEFFQAKIETNRKAKGQRQSPPTSGPRRSKRNRGRNRYRCDYICEDKG